MKNYSTSLFSLLIACSMAQAQVVKTPLVEHFTNTSCGICAGNNPSIYSAINNNPPAIHISFHPSAPYRSDIFSQQNLAENDNRTKFYGVYGGTPQVVLNGVSISYSNLNSELTRVVPDTSNYEVKATQQLLGVDSFITRVVVSKVAADPITKALLFVGVSEDTIIQTGNNGEPRHYNVFRKALTTDTGTVLALPTLVNDSTVTIFRYRAQTGWAITRLKELVIVQKIGTHESINAARSKRIASQATATAIDETKEEPSLTIYPNPVNNALHIISDYTIDNPTVINLLGQTVYETAAKTNIIDVSDIPSGMYLLTFTIQGKQIVKRISVQH